MAVVTKPATVGSPADNWYAKTPDAVASDLGVDPDVGLAASRAAERLAANGPNALPEAAEPVSVLPS